MAKNTKKTNILKKYDPEKKFVGKSDPKVTKKIMKMIDDGTLKLEK